MPCAGVAGCHQPAAVDASFVALAKKEAHDLRTRICVLNGNEFRDPL